MYTTIVFLLLCIIELVIIWMKWDEIQTYRDIVEGAASITGADKNERYSQFVKIMGKVIEYAKPVLIVLAILLLFANLIAASIIGGILGFIF